MTRSQVAKSFPDSLAQVRRIGTSKFGKAGPPDEPRDPKTGKWTTGGLSAERERFSSMSRREFLRATAESMAVLAILAGPPIQVAARLYHSSKMQDDWNSLGEASREALAKGLESKGFKVDRNEDGSIDVWTQKGEPVWRSPKGRATHKALTFEEALNKGYPELDRKSVV